MVELKKKGWVKLSKTFNTIWQIHICLDNLHLLSPWSWNKLPLHFQVFRSGGGFPSHHHTQTFFLSGAMRSPPERCDLIGAVWGQQWLNIYGGSLRCVRGHPTSCPRQDVMRVVGVRVQEEMTGSQLATANSCETLWKHSRNKLSVAIHVQV